MKYFIFTVILLHVIAGFGWLLYKLEFQKDKSKDKDALTDDPTKKQS